MSCSKEKEKELIIEQEFIIKDSGSLLGSWKMIQKTFDGSLKPLNEVDSESTVEYTIDSIIFYRNEIRTGSKAYETRTEYDSTIGQIKLMKLIDNYGYEYDLQYDIYLDTLYLRLNWTTVAEEWYVRL